MSFISGIVKFFQNASTNNATPPATLKTPSPPQQPPRPKVGIFVEVTPRIGSDIQTYPFGFDQPGNAFEITSAMLVNHPLMYDSVRAHRVDASGTRELIFTVTMYLDPRNQMYEYTPTFPGSWSPPEAFRTIQSVRRR